MIDPNSLRRFSMFRTVDSGALSALAGAMQRRSYPAGAVLFRKGDPGGTMMLIMAGQVRIFLNDEQDHPITLRMLGAGQVVGEFSLLDHKSRTASASAVTALDVLVLQRADFIRILHERPLVGVELMRSLAERIRYATSYLERLYDATELLTRSEYDMAIREMALSSDEDEMRELITTFLKLVHRLQATDSSNRQK